MPEKTRLSLPTAALLRLVNHLRVNAVAYVALFVALSAGAYAAGVAKNSVKSKHIRDGTVKTRDLRDGAVTGAKVAEGAIGPRELALRAVGPGAIAPGAVGPAAIAQEAVGPAAIADGAIRSAAVADGAIGPAALAAGAVGPGAIADGAIRPAALAQGAVGPAALAQGAVGPAALAPGAVGPAALAPGAVGSEAIAQGAVGPGAIAPNAITGAQIDEATLQGVDAAKVGGLEIKKVNWRVPMGTDPQTVLVFPGKFRIDAQCANFGDFLDVTAFTGENDSLASVNAMRISGADDTNDPVRDIASRFEATFDTNEALEIDSTSEGFNSGIATVHLAAPSGFVATVQLQMYWRPERCHISGFAIGG